MIKLISVVLAVLMIGLVLALTGGIALLLIAFLSMLPEAAKFWAFLAMVVGFLFSFLFINGGGVELAEGIEKRLRSLLDKEERL